MSVTTTLHLNFRDQARAALEFYQSVFGGDLVVVTYGDGGIEDVGPEHADKVVWGQVQAPSGFHVMAYDVQPTREHDPGVNAFYTALRGADADEIQRLWDGLTDGATIEVPMGPSVFSPLYGKLTDRFGVIWIVDVMVPYAG